MRELKIPLPNGNFLCCGEGHFYEWGGWVSIRRPDHTELFHWTAAEWEQKDEGESVMGAIFLAALSIPSDHRTVRAVAKQQGRDYITPEDVEEALKRGADRQAVREEVLRAVARKQCEDPSACAFTALNWKE